MQIGRKQEVEKSEDFEEERWDIKRIGIAAVVVLLLLGLGGYSFTSFFKNNTREKGKVVLGSRGEDAVGSSNVSKEEVKLPTREDVNKIITSAQENLSKITSENLTSSQAAIQKIVHDLQELQGGKKSATDVFCELVCKK